MANQPKKYKKFVATAATATLVASAIVPVASAASLTDIAGNTHEAAITSLVDAGIINGYADGTFKPNKELTRSDVVKLLGKYLVTQGYEIPSDAVSSPRFADLTSKSNKELLEYAAVVADAGVFAGSNGKLLAGDPITRENMAIVLVRMVNTLKDVSLEDYVDGQKFDKEVKDLNVAKAEARSAINVLDFYDITTATNFLPKNTVTRGQFATFLNNVIKADFTGVSTTTGTVKAINATTVEVTYADTVDNINALKFTIDGLTVSNAAVKQTDKKTVVLTTSAQTAGVEYTVKESGNEIGKFTGISAVIPTAIKVTTPSVQGTIGKEVTVSAQVTVPEGQSKAGIPVTFNISNADSNLNSKIEVVAYTNAEGVASYSYTRYYKANDSVAAYATDKSTVVSYGTVYWANSLAVKEVTTATTLANGSKKVYEVTGAANTVVNVAFKENVQVDPSKLVRTVEIKDAKVYELLSNGNIRSTSASSSYPYEVTTGGVQFATITLDREGKGTFTLEGSNATVTPVVFVDEKTYYTESGVTKYAGDGKLGAQELQASAPSVTFSLQHTLALDVEAKGSANAAADTSSTSADFKDVNSGGRTYEVTVRTNEGKLAPETTPAYVTFEEGSLSPDKVVYIDGVRAVEGQVYKIEVKGKEGKASFRLTGAKDAFAQPTVFLDNGTSVGAVKLDKSDLKVVSAQTFFVDAVVKTATLKATAEGITKENKVVVGIPTTFTYQSTDQNGFPYYEGTNYNVTFQLSTTFGNLTGVLVNGQSLGTTRSVTVGTTNGAAAITIQTDRASDINVTASANNRTLPIVTTSVEYVAGLAALAAVNDADNAKEVLAALKLDDTFRTKLLALPDANQEAIAAAIYAGLPSTNGYSEAGLKAAFTTAYATQAAAVQAAEIAKLVVKAGGATALTVADLNNVPEVDTTELATLPTADIPTALGNIKTAIAAAAAAVVAPATLTVEDIQDIIDTEVVVRKAANSGTALRALIANVEGALNNAAALTALAAVPGVDLTALNAAHPRVKQLVLEDVVGATSFADVAAINALIRTQLDTEKNNVSVAINSVELTSTTSLDIVFNDDVNLPTTGTISTADLGALGITFVDGNTLGTNATATYAANTLTITLGADHNIVGGTSVLKSISLKDEFGVTVDLAAVVPGTTTLITLAGNLLVAAAPTAPVASTDATITGLTVAGVVAAGTGNTYTVSVPTGTTVTATDVVATATDTNATVATATETAPGSNVWNVVVTAEDGTTTETYTVTVTVL